MKTSLRNLEGHDQVSEMKLCFQVHLDKNLRLPWRETDGDEWTSAELLAEHGAGNGSTGKGVRSWQEKFKGKLENFLSCKERDDLKVHFVFC